jgi:hypothetical protein
MSWAPTTAPSRSSWGSGILPHIEGDRAPEERVTMAETGQQEDGYITRGAIAPN